MIRKKTNKKFTGSSPSILWAPWRYEYIRRIQKEPKGCLFCNLIKSKNDAKSLIIDRSNHSFAVMNRYPYNTGHIMIVPNRHVGELGELSDIEILDLMRLHHEMFERLKLTLKPGGFNMGINFGRVGGAGVVGHVHLHVVPRWMGDNNFMPIIGQTKVISESLKSLHKRLVDVQPNRTKRRRG